MSNAFSLSFTLQQHTPLIHFQHEQRGATLRATELKPKLDRFLAQKITGQENPSLAEIMAHPEYGQCLIGGTKAQSLAFDYKVKVIPGPEKETFRKLEVEKKEKNGKTKYLTDGDKFQCILANMGGQDSVEELKNFVFHETVSVQILSFHTKLRALVKDAFPGFIAMECFGNRNSKGFGSFSCSHVNGIPVNIDTPLRYYFTCNLLQQNFQYAAPKNEFDQQRILFSVIDLFYKTLRSGINYGHKSFYFKSLLFRYAQDRLKETWDKKSIKLKYVDQKEVAEKIDHRDLLGFSTIEEWLKQGAQVTKESDIAERFKSPIIFKPVRTGPETFRVYFDYTSIPEEFRNAKITVKWNGQGNLQLQPSNKFKLDEFFEYILKIDLVQHVIEFDKKDLGCDENSLFTKTILPVYQSIKKNLVNQQP